MFDFSDIQFRPKTNGVRQNKNICVYSIEYGNRCVCALMVYQPVHSHTLLFPENLADLTYRRISDILRSLTGL